MSAHLENVAQKAGPHPVRHPLESIVLAEHVAERQLQVLLACVFDYTHEAMEIIARGLVVEAVLACADNRFGMRETLSIGALRCDRDDLRVV